MKKKDTKLKRAKWTKRKANQETLHLSRSPANKRRLREAIEDIRAGRGFERDDFK